MISVVIPAYNAEDTIGHCLSALLDQSLPREAYEIIVVDDGSTDGTRDVVRRYPGARLIEQANQGPAAARNLGGREARGDIVLFTDADCQPIRTWIERMSVPFEDQEVVGAKGTYLTRQRALVARFVQIEYEDKYDRMARDESIDFIDTYAAGYRRDVFLANGGFDTSFPIASVEDQEFSFRLAAQGHKMVFVPEAQVYHLHADTLTGYLRKKFKIGYWKVLVHRRHPDKMIRDSHTPQVLKIQILLTALLGATVLGTFFWKVLGWMIAAEAAIFGLSTLPFVIKAWSKDRVVAFIAPLLLLGRALALGLGFLTGLVGIWQRLMRQRGALSDVKEI